MTRYMSIYNKMQREHRDWSSYKLQRKTIEKLDKLDEVLHPELKDARDATNRLVYKLTVFVVAVSILITVFNFEILLMQAVDLLK